MVKVKWLGHACFEIKGETVTIVTDPHDGTSLNIPRPKAEADIVLVSHTHFDHMDGIKFVKRPDAEEIVAKTGEMEIKGVKIKGIKSYHDKSMGRQRGENVIYVFEVDGVRFCHLGDLGHILTDEQVREIGEVDVLLIPVGGTFTIDAREASEIIEMLKPKIVIPMHYKIKGLNLPISGVEEFIADKKNVEKISGSEVEITKENLPGETKIIVLSI